jgi:hypothetical protein
VFDQQQIAGNGCSGGQGETSENHVNLPKVQGIRGNAAPK